MAVPWARCPSQTQRIRPLVRLFLTQNELGISKALVDGLNFSVSLTFGALGRLNTSSSYLKLLYNQNLAWELIGWHFKQAKPLSESAGLWVLDSRYGVTWWWILFCQPRWSPLVGFVVFMLKLHGQCPIRMFHGSTPLALQFPMCSESLLPSKPSMILTSFGTKSRCLWPLWSGFREALWMYPHCLLF